MRRLPTTSRNRSTLVTPCFPEPLEGDLASGRGGESMASFLMRSTQPHAVNLRAFINDNLADLPAPIGGALCNSLHSERFESAHFELVVARVLQVLGATDLAYQGSLETGRQPDFVAQFEDGSLTVDATRPEWDAALARKYDNYRTLIEIVEDEIPPRWHFFAERLPVIGPADSKKEFRRAIRGAFDGLPSLPNGQQWRVAVDHPSGEVRLVLFRGPVRERPYYGGPASTAWSDPEKRIVRALRHKRPQLRGGTGAQVLAIAGGMTEDLEDFDIHLFGRTVGHIDVDGEVHNTGFDRSGVWGSLRGGTSVVAGVLAFCRLQFTVGDDPVLYINPRYEGSFPSALLDLEHRTLGPDAIVISPAAVQNLMRQL